MTAVCACVVWRPVVHEGHCCGTRCGVHDPLIAAAIIACGGWGAWLHTAPRARAQHLGQETP